jgi:hypothetical protein
VDETERWRGRRVEVSPVWHDRSVDVMYEISVRFSLGCGCLWSLGMPAYLT